MRAPRNGQACLTTHPGRSRAQEVPDGGCTSHSRPGLGNEAVIHIDWGPETMCRARTRYCSCEDRIKCQKLAKHTTNHLPTVDLSTCQPGLPGRFVSNPTAARDSSAADLCFPEKDWKGTRLGGGMRQGWPFETTIRAAVGTNPQGLPLEPASAWGAWPLPQQVPHRPKLPRKYA